jgi:putative oxidoreductase
MTDAGPQFGMPGYEINVLYIAGLAALVLFGRSELSVDKWIDGKKES